MRLFLLGLGVAAPLMAQARDSTAADSAKAQPLPTVQVTVTRGNEAARRVPASIGVVTGREIQTAQLTVGLDEALSRIPGVFVVNRFNYSVDERLSIRGAGARANFGLRGVKVLLDGIPQTLPDGQSQLSNVDFGMIDRAEVLVGAASALYGNGSGGVLSLSTAIPAEGFHQRLRGIAGGLGTSKVASTAGWRSGGTDAWLGLSRFATDGFRQHSRAEARQVSAGFDRVLSGTTRASLRYYFADLPRAENPGALTAAEVAARPDSAAASNILRGADKAVTQHQLGLSLHQADARGNEAELTLFGLSRDLVNPLATAPPGPTGAIVGTYSAIGRLAGGWRASLGRSLTSSVRLRAGVDAQLMRDDRVNRRSRGGTPTDTVVVDQREKVFELGPYASLHWELSPRVLLLTGLRFDRVRFSVEDHFLADGVDNSGVRTMSAASGSLGLSWTVSPRFVPYANVATAFETPTTTELVNQANGAVGFNLTLNPQRSVSAEIGMRGEERGWRYSVAAYSTSVRDALVQVRELNGRAFFQNAGHLRHRGLEIGVGASPLRWLHADLAYTFADSRFTDYRIPNGAVTDTLDGKRVPAIPRHSLRAVLDFFLGSTSVAIDHQRASSIFADDKNTLRADAWGSTSIRASHVLRLGGQTFTPFAQVQNAFNRRSVPSVTVNGFGGRVFEPAPGRQVYAGVDVRLGRP